MQSLTQWLNNLGYQIAVYDMGRRVTPLDPKGFLDFERGAQPYPYPIAGQARFAFCFFSTNQPEPIIWLLKLSLDEQGKPDVNEYNAFLRYISQQWQNDGNRPAQQQHPFAYKPTDDKMAMLYSRLTQWLQQPVSIHYESAQEYFCRDGCSELWQHLTVQGVADLVLLAEQDANLAENLASHMATLPTQARRALAHQLTHSAPHPVLSDALLKQLQQAVTQQQSSLTDWLNACAGITHAALQPVLLQYLTKASHVNSEIAIILAGRCWSALTSPLIMLAYLERVAQLQDQALFKSLYTDLVAIPETRPFVLASLRHPQRSQQLSKAIGQLFNDVIH